MATKTKPMRGKRDQANQFDRTVENPALEALLLEQIELEPQAKLLRSKKKDIRKIIETEHPELLDVGEDESGWVRVGTVRFRPRATEREAGEVQIGAGVNWACPAEKL